MYEGWTVEKTHEECATCDECVAIAYTFAVDWGSPAHGHTTTDEQGVNHTGVVRKVEE
jgi:hypothetical protein